MNAFDVSCERLVGLATKYLDDLLGDDERVSIELHLLRCPTCIIYLDNLARTIRILSSLRASPVTHERRQALVTAFSTRHGVAP
jgi:Putative zinc-finger